MRPFFFLREALRALRRNAAPSLAAFATVLITTLVLGVFIPVVRAATAKTNEVRNKIELEVFINDDASQGRDRGARQHDPRHPPRREHRLHQQGGGAADPQAQARATSPTITEDLPGNPLPRSYRIKLDDPQNADVVKSSLEPAGPNGEPRPISPAIQEVKDREDDTQKILSATSTIKILLASLAGLLVLASVLLVANTIRLVDLRPPPRGRGDAAGGGDQLVHPLAVRDRGPARRLPRRRGGGRAAVGGEGHGRGPVVGPLRADRRAGHDQFSLLVLVLLGAATAVSALGSGITLRRFLRV